MQAGVNARSGWGHRRDRRLAVVSPANRREAADAWQNSDVKSATPRTSISATKGKSRSRSAGPIPSLRDEAISGGALDRGRKSRNDRPTRRWRSRLRSTKALSALTATAANALTWRAQGRRAGSAERAPDRRDGRGKPFRGSRPGRGTHPLLVAVASVPQASGFFRGAVDPRCQRRSACDR